MKTGKTEHEMAKTFVLSKYESCLSNFVISHLWKKAEFVVQLHNEVMIPRFYHQLGYCLSLWY